MKVVEILNRTIDAAALNGQIVAFDNNSYTIRFHLKKMFNEETDLSEYTWYLIFVNSDQQGDVVALSAPTLDGDSHFYVDWQPGGVFTQTGGGCYLQLFAVNGDNKWHTEQCYIVVRKALTSDSTSPLAPSVLLTYLTTFQGLKTDAADSAASALESKNAAATSEQNALLYKQQTDQNRAQVATDKGAVATDKAAAEAYKNAALQALADMHALVLAAEAAAAAEGSPVAVIEGDQYTVGMVVSRGRTYLSVIPVSS